MSDQPLWKQYSDARGAIEELVSSLTEFQAIEFNKRKRIFFAARDEQIKKIEAISKTNNSILVCEKNRYQQLKICFALFFVFLLGLTLSSANLVQFELLALALLSVVALILTLTELSLNKYKAMLLSFQQTVDMLNVKLSEYAIAGGIGSEGEFRRLIGRLPSEVSDDERMDVERFYFLLDVRILASIGVDDPRMKGILFDDVSDLVAGRLIWGT